MDPCLSLFLPKQHATACMLLPHIIRTKTMQAADTVKASQAMEQSPILIMEKKLLLSHHITCLLHDIHTQTSGCM